MIQKSRVLGLAGALAASVVLSLTVYSCASVPKTEAPAWVQSGTRDEGANMVFVASGSSNAGNPADAEKKAVVDLTNQIQNYIGVSVTSSTTAKAVATLDSYKADIEQTVTSTSTRRVSGFVLGERFTVTRGDMVYVYLKGMYDKAAIEKERARIAAVFKEQDEAISGPEAEAKALLNQGMAYKAFEKFVQAAAASSSSDVENADIKFERNMNQARDILSKITLLPVNGSQKTAVGQDFPSPFAIKVVWGPDASSPVVPDVTLRFNYKVKRGNNLGTASAQIKSGPDGVASFIYPTPNFAGSDNVVVLLDVNPYIETLAKVPRKYLSQVNALEELAAKNRAVMAFTVESNAKNVPMGIFLADTDENGTLLRRSDTQAGIQQALNGFRITPVSGAQAAQVQGDEASVLAAFKPLLGASKRVIFGQVNITEMTPESGGFTARASGTVKCLDVATGEVLFTSTKNKRARGATREAAIAAATRQLGEDFGKALADQLP